MAIWSGKSSTKKIQVKIKGLKLEGLEYEGQERVKMAIEIKWEGGLKSGFSSFYKKSQSLITNEIEIHKLGKPIEWNNEFDNICSFSINNSKIPNSFAPWIVSFQLLYGKSEELSSSTSTSSSSSCKMQVIGKTKLNLGELASKMDAQIVQKLPISLEVDGFTTNPSLQVVVNFVEIRNNTSHSRTLSHDSFEIVPNPIDSVSVLRRSTSQVIGQEKPKKNKTRLFGKQLSLRKFTESSTTFNSESEYVVVASSSKTGESNSITELKSSTSSETQLDLVKKGGFWKWKRRKSMNKVDKVESNYLDAEKPNNPSSWETRELVSRDGKTKLKASMFFASFDQCSEKAAGQSACAAIVAVIAHWLQLYPDMIFTASEFDRLITEGSSEWRKLCTNQSNNVDFHPDQHFDLETILRAELRPLAVLPNNARIGFFHPDEFDHLKGATSFDEIWNEINTNVNEFEPRVYIVRWNEHFFILKVEDNANYIIDSLGERLYEGCNQAYVLKFDDSSMIYEKVEETKVEGKAEKCEDKTICRGKECCREYMKRFLAAIPLRELKEEEAKGKNIDVIVMYKRLQIDFHLSSHSSSANTSITSSPNLESHYTIGDDDGFAQI